MTEPTKAALRAAQRLFPNMLPRDDQKIIATAELIDLETGLPQLLAACRAALNDYDSYALGDGSPEDPQWAVVQQLRAAIAATEETP